MTGTLSYPEHRELATLRRAGSVILLALAALTLVSCASSQGMVGGTRVTPTANGSLVEVNLTEHQILMPNSVPSGTVTFKVSNTGSHAHNLEIEVDDTDRKFETNLKPGETRELTVTLAPGSYDITCPVGAHAMLGMRRTLTVTPPATSRSGGAKAR
jgi:hypothetical protein